MKKKEKEIDPIEARRKTIKKVFREIRDVGILLIIIGVLLMIGAYNMLNSSTKTVDEGGWVPSTSTTKTAKDQEEKESIAHGMDIAGLVIGVVGIIIVIYSPVYKKNALSKLELDVKLNENKSESSKSSETSTDKISELKEMLDKNLITQEEFETKKKEILEKM